MEPVILDHPLAHHKLTLMRDRKTSGTLFRQLVEEVGLLLAVEASRHLSTEIVALETPLERTQGRRLPALDPVMVPVLRAGLGLLQPFLQLMPTAKVGAPPARLRMVFSPMSLAVAVSTSGVMAKPHSDTLAATATTSLPTAEGGVFIAK